LRELSTKPRNVAIPTIRIQSLKYPKGNCMRNYRADGAGRGADEQRQGQARQNSHIISHGHFWRPPTNVAIATTPIHGLK
jgi:hypothetical protein